MTAIDQAFSHATLSENEEDRTRNTSSHTAGLPAGANRPHVAFPSPAPCSAETSRMELDPIATDSELPDSKLLNHDMLETLDQVARENLLATGTVELQVPVAPAPTNLTPVKRPLSEFVAVEPARQETFKPALVVDQYCWPAVCEQLVVQHSSLLNPVVEVVQKATEQGCALIGFLGAEPQAGCTTMLLSLARRLAALGSHVAILDADFATAAMGDRKESSLDLASQLGLEVTVGWEDILAGRVPLAEGVVQSVVEPIAILPVLRRPNSAYESLQIVQTHGIQASVTAGVFRAHYDVVLVDLGCATEQVQVSTARAIVQHCRLDATLIVTRESTAETAQLPSAMIEPTPGTVCLGVIENWAEEFPV